MDNVPPIYPPVPPNRNWIQRNWMWFVPAGCLSLILLGVLAVGGIAMIVMGALKSSDAYKTSIGRAENNPQVVNALGSPVKAGMFVSGNTNVNGSSGNADLQVPLSGPKGKGTLYFVATKSEGNWNFSKMKVHVDATGEDIDLLAGPPSAP